MPASPKSKSAGFTGVTRTLLRSPSRSISNSRGLPIPVRTVKATSCQRLDFLAVDRDDLVAGQEAGLGTRRVRLDRADDRRHALQRRHLDADHEQAGDEQDRERAVHQRTGEVDQDALPARLVEEVARVVGRFSGLFAGELDVAAERHQRDLVLGLADLPAEQALSEAEREGEHLHAEGLGDQEVAGFVDEDDDAESEDEGGGIG